ncbi:MAG: hypothetical protein MK135_12285 [Polyangiaceae bacterium]|nr:hypothetical protein [Polyangiaceae bacterium]
MVADDVMVTLIDRRMTKAGFEEYLRWIDNDLRTWPEDRQRVVFYSLMSVSDFGPGQRKQLAKLLNRYRHKLKTITSGYALVTPSAIGRGLLTAVFWLAPPGYPTHICASPEEGFLWLAQYSKNPDVEAWIAGYERCRREFTELEQVSA